MRHLVLLVWVFAFAGLMLPATGMMLCSHGDGCSRWSLASVHDHDAACDAHQHDGEDEDAHHGHDHDAAEGEGDAEDHGGPGDRDLRIGPLAIRFDHGLAVVLALAPSQIAVAATATPTATRAPDRAALAPARPPSAPLVLRI